METRKSLKKEEDDSKESPVGIKEEEVSEESPVVEKEEVVLEESPVVEKEENVSGESPVVKKEEEISEELPVVEKKEEVLEESLDVKQEPSKKDQEPSKEEQEPSKEEQPLDDDLPKPQFIVKQVPLDSFTRRRWRSPGEEEQSAEDTDHSKKTPTKKIVPHRALSATKIPVLKPWAQRSKDSPVSKTEKKQPLRAQSATKIPCLTKAFSSLKIKRPGSPKVSPVKKIWERQPLIDIPTIKMAGEELETSESLKDSTKKEVTTEYMSSSSGSEIHVPITPKPWLVKRMPRPRPEDYAIRGRDAWEACQAKRMRPPLKSLMHIVKRSGASKASSKKATEEVPTKHSPIEKIEPKLPLRTFSSSTVQRPGVSQPYVIKQYGKPQSSSDIHTNTTVKKVETRKPPSRAYSPTKFQRPEPSKALPDKQPFKKMVTKKSSSDIDSDIVESKPRLSVAALTLQKFQSLTVRDTSTIKEETAGPSKERSIIKKETQPVLKGSPVLKKEKQPLSKFSAKKGTKSSPQTPKKDVPKEEAPVVEQIQPKYVPWRTVVRKQPLGCLPPMKNDRILKVIRGEKPDRVPVWLLNQSGRYTDTYYKFVKEFGRLQLWQRPEIISKLSLLPAQKYPFDAAVMHSELMMIPHALGLAIEMKEFDSEPILSKPLTCETIKNLQVDDSIYRLRYYADAVTITRFNLKGRVPLIGYTPGPFTLLSYLLEGKSSRRKTRTRRWLYIHPKESHEVLGILTDVIVDFLAMQVDAGAQMAMVHDSNCDLLSVKLFQDFCVPYLRRIYVEVNAKLLHMTLPKVPMIVFAQGVNHSFELQKELGYEVTAINSVTQSREARNVFGPESVLQGNIDPYIFYGYDDDYITKTTKQMIKDFGTVNFIANIGEEAPVWLDPHTVKVFLDAVHNFRI